MAKRTKAPRGRRRGTHLEDAVLEAAWAELATAGYDGLRVDAVAARARTSKTVLYRRWPTRAELVLAALRKHAEVDAKTPDSGSLRRDLILTLTWLSDRYRDFPEIVRGLMVELPDAEASVVQSSMNMMKTIIDRAIERGEIDPRKITPRIARVPLDLARYEMFVTRQPLARKQILEIVDRIFMPLVLTHLPFAPAKPASARTSFS